MCQATIQARVTVRGSIPDGIEVRRQKLKHNRFADARFNIRGRGSGVPGTRRTADGGAAGRLCAMHVGRTARAVAVAGAAVGAATKSGAGRTADHVVALPTAAHFSVVAVIAGGTTGKGLGAGAVAQLLAGFAADGVLGLVLLAVYAANQVAVHLVRITCMQGSTVFTLYCLEAALGFFCASAPGPTHSPIMKVVGHQWCST